MTSISYAAALAEFEQEVWAIAPKSLNAMRDALTRGGNEVAAAPVVGARLQDPQPARGTAIGVLPLVGPISHRPTAWQSIFGGTSLMKWVDQLQLLMTSSTVRGIVIDVDSPGGSVNGVEEAAQAIAEAASKKPVIAVVNTLMASAAYWLASQAGKVLMTPSAAVGSIGVYSLHLDYSRALDKAGVTPTFVYAGKNKVDGNPYQPLTDEAKKDEQRIVDFYYNAFVNGVANGRGLSESWVREHMADGRIHNVKSAVGLRFVDGTVSGLPQAIAMTAETNVGRLAGDRNQFMIAEAIDPGGHGRLESMRIKLELDTM